MHKIFISYRREDEAFADLLETDLEQWLGRDSVFVDQSDLRAGHVFSTEIQNALRECEVLLVLISNTWLIKQDDGKRKIDQPDDWVRREIEMALDHGIPVLPVLIKNATIPAKADLPESLSKLVDCHAAKFHLGRDREYYFEQLKSDLTLIFEKADSAAMSGSEQLLSGPLDAAEVEPAPVEFEPAGTGSGNVNTAAPPTEVTRNPQTVETVDSGLENAAVRHPKRSRIRTLMTLILRLFTWPLRNVIYFVLIAIPLIVYFVRESNEGKYVAATVVGCLALQFCCFRLFRARHNEKHFLHRLVPRWYSPQKLLAATIVSFLVTLIATGVAVDYCLSNKIAWSQTYPDEFRFNVSFASRDDPPLKERIAYEKEMIAHERNAHYAPPDARLEMLNKWESTRTILKIESDPPFHRGCRRFSVRAEFGQEILDQMACRTVDGVYVSEARDVGKEAAKWDPNESSKFNAGGDRPIIPGQRLIIWILVDAETTQPVSDFIEKSNFKLKITDGDVPLGEGEIVPK